MAAINADPEVTRYLNRPIGPVESAAFHARVLDHWARHGFGFWAVAAWQPSSVPSGLLGFVGVHYPTFAPELASRPEIGWRLARPAWGHGLATEAALAVRDHAFATRALAELISIIDPHNARSRRVAAKLGMVLEGQVRNPVIDRDVEVWQIASPPAA